MSYRNALGKLAAIIERRLARWSMSYARKAAECIVYGVAAMLYVAALPVTFWTEYFELADEQRDRDRGNGSEAPRETD